MAIHITGYGGVEEIGGNCFELSDGRSTILLDVGLRFGEARFETPGRQPPPGDGDFFEMFGKEPGSRAVLYRQHLGLLPRKDGWWRQDLGGRPGARPDGVVLSHAHLDHVGHLPYLDPEIPIHATAPATAILGSLSTTGTGVSSQFMAAIPGNVMAPARSVTKEFQASHTVHRDFVPERTQFGDFEVESMRVDHSIAGAQGSIITHKDATIAYTGDLRVHGRNKQWTEDYLQRIGDVDVLIIEGTNVRNTAKYGRGSIEARDQDDHGHGNHTELEVEAEIEDAILAHGKQPDSDGFVAIAYPPRDSDRLQSIRNVAKRLGRVLVVTPQQAHVLRALKDAGEPVPDPHGPDIRILLHGSSIEYTDPDAVDPDFLAIAKTTVDEEVWKGIKGYAKAFDASQWVTMREIVADPRAYIVSVTTFTMSNLLALDAWRPTRSLYIHSMTQPFNDEMEFGAKRLGFWLEKLRFDRKDTHVSGHLSEEDLFHALDQIGARKLIPIHGQSVRFTAEQYQARTGFGYELLEMGQPHRIV